MMFPGTEWIVRAGTAAVCGVPVVLPMSQLVAQGDPRVESLLQVAAGGAIALALWVARSGLQRIRELDTAIQRDRIQTSQRIARLEIDTAARIAKVELDAAHELREATREIADIKARIAHLEKEEERA